MTPLPSPVALMPLWRGINEIKSGWNQVQCTVCGIMNALQGFHLNHYFILWGSHNILFTVNMFAIIHMQDNFKCVSTGEKKSVYLNVCCVCAYLSWSLAGSMAAVKLEGIITRTSLLKDVRQLSPQHQTYSLEAFHSLILHFAPKHTGFSYHGMYSRSVLSNGITMPYFIIHTPGFESVLKCVIL